MCLFRRENLIRITKGWPISIKKTPSAKPVDATKHAGHCN